jgi:hypothetical protein
MQSEVHIVAGRYRSPKSLTFLPVDASQTGIINHSLGLYEQGQTVKKFSTRMI